MSANSSSDDRSPQTTVPAVGSLDPAAAGPDDLTELLDQLATADRAIARVVALAGQVGAAGIAEVAEGMPLDLVLTNIARLVGSDAATIRTAADVLADMPTTAGRFACGEISWGQVRAVVRSLRRRSTAFRAAIDARIDATLSELGGADRMAPDQLVWAIENAVADLDADLLIRRDDTPSPAHDRGSFLSLQLGFDGHGTLYGELDAVSMGVVVNALDAAAGPPDDGAATRTGAGWTPPGRARQHAAALIDVAAAYLGGAPDRPAKPLIVAHVDIADVTTTRAGTVEVNLLGLPTTISLATLDQLACDATLRTVVFDGAQPLAVAERTRAASIPAPTRIAVAARDGGDRFPGSRAPLAWCDVHHIRERAQGGDHHPTNLLALSRRTHTLVHHHGWRISRTGHSDRVDVVAFDHPNGRRLHSTPLTTRLRQPSGREPPDDGPQDLVPGIPF